MSDDVAATEAAALWRLLLLQQKRLGWTDIKLSGHIRKHYRGVRPDVRRPPIGEFMALSPDDRSRLLAEMEGTENVGRA